MEATYEVLKNDSSYKTAVNYNKGDSFYNFPTTIVVNDNKYILGAGFNDRITFKQINDTLYIITSNYELNYISLEKIDLTDNSFEDYLYLDSRDLSCDENVCFDLLSKSPDEQLDLILTNY